MAMTYDAYLKKLGGRRVNAGEDWKDVHEEVLKGYAASHPDNPIPQASGGGEIGAIGQATERSGPPQLGILPNRSATTSATSAGAPLPEAPAIKPSKPLSPGTVLGSTMRDLPPVDPNSAPATVAPVVAPANAGVDGIPTGGPEGWKGGAPNQAPKTAFGDLQATIQNQVEKAVWGSTLTPQPSNAAQPKQAPAQASYSNEGRNYPAGGGAKSPANATSEPKPKAADGLDTGRDLSSTLGAVPANLPKDQMVANALYKVTDPKTGRTVYSGYGDSSKPTFAAGQGMFDGKGNAIQSRGSVQVAASGSPVYMDANGNFGFTPSPYGDKGTPAEVLAARKAEVAARLTNPDGTQWSATDNAIRAANVRDGRTGAEVYYGTSRDPRNTPAALAAAASAARPSMAQRLNDLTSPESTALRNLQLSLQVQPHESQVQYQARAAAIQSQINTIMGAEALTSNERQAGARDAIELRTQGNEAARLGIEKGKLSLDEKRIASDLASAEQNRAIAGMSLDAARKVSDLQAQYMAAEGDPKTRAKLAQSIRDLTGKEAKADWKFHATPTIKNADGSTTEGTAYMVNERTNEVVKVGDQKKPAAAQQYEVGKTYTKSVNGTPGNYRFIGIDGNGKEMWKPA